MATQKNPQISLQTVSFGRAVAYFVNGFIYFANALLLFRVFFLLFSANPETPFVTWVYKVTTDLMAPFRGIFPTKPVGETGYLDISAIFAIIFYLILSSAITNLMHYLDNKKHKLEKEQAEYEKVQSKN
jgi:uncharacterized protein YggT (Ycf19 family)